MIGGRDYIPPSNIAGWKMDPLKMHFLLKIGYSIAMVVCQRVAPLEGNISLVYSRGIYCQLDDDMLPTTPYKNLKNPLKRWGSKVESDSIPGWMYGVCTCTWLIFMVNVGKYSIHGPLWLCIYTIVYHSPLKIDGWKMKCPFKIVPFQGTC